MRTQYFFQPTNDIVALELEPDNESYKSNLQIAEDKVSSGVGGGAPAGFPGMFPGMGGKSQPMREHYSLDLNNQRSVFS